MQAQKAGGSIVSIANGVAITRAPFGFGLPVENSLQIGPNVTRSGKPILGSDGENTPTPSAEK
jgi:hypothetical protein